MNMVIVFFIIHLMACFLFVVCKFETDTETPNWLIVNGLVSLDEDGVEEWNYPPESAYGE